MAKLFSNYHRKLITLNLILSLIPIIIISSYLFFDKINDETKNLQEKLIFISNKGAENIATWIDERKNNIHDIAKNDIVITETKKLLDPEASAKELFVSKLSIEKQLQTSVDSYDWLTELMITSPKTGEVIFSTSDFQSKLNFSEENHFQQALEHKIGLSEIFPSKIILKNEYGEYEKGVPTLLISSPISSEVGLEGVLTVRVDVFKIISGIEKHSDFSTLDNYLVNSDGYFISESKFKDELLRQNIIEKRSPLELRVIEPNSGQLTKIFASTKNFESQIDFNGYTNYMGSTVVGLIKPVTNTNWYYIVEVDKQEAFLEIVKLEVTLIIIISLILFTIIAISILFAKNLVDPINALTKVVQKFDINKTNEELAELRKLSHGRNDEISKLYQTLRSMTGSIKKSSQALKLAEEKYRSLYNGLPDLCRTINKDGIILDCNKAYAKRLGYSKEEVIGKSIFEHVSYDNADDLRSSFETWRNSGTVYNREVKLRRKDGISFQTLISATNLYDANEQLIGSNTIIKDISDIQTLLEVDKAKDEFASMVSHELKTPLIPIMGYCEMLKNPKFFGKLTDTQLEAINEIYDNSVRLNNLINEVLKAQKLELRKLTLKKENFEVDELMQTVFKSNSSLIHLKQITFVNNFTSNTKIVVQSDKDKLMEVFTNLIQNAVDFVPEKTGRIEIGAIDNADSVLFYVKDNGIGIAPDKIKKLFTKFYQIDTSFSRNHGGSGLGLVICKGIVNGLGGEIKVESTVGKGTTFSFTIPKDDKLDWK